MQAYNSIMRVYFYVRFIDFMLKGKSLLDYSNSFSPNDYEKNDAKICQMMLNNAKIFSITKKMKKIYCVICGKCR